MSVPFLDLDALHADLRPEFDEAYRRVLDSGVFILGPEVHGFEMEFAEFAGGGHAVAVNSGTSALHLALLAVGVGPGDEVIVPSMTFVATVAAVVYTGATPVFVDVDAATWTVDCDAVEAAVTSRTRALVPVHLHGRAADLQRLSDIAARHGVSLVEDAAQAHGAQSNAGPVGLVGDIAAFSFYPGKNLGALGEGGLVLTLDETAAERVRLLRDWGAKEKYHHEAHAFNYRMDALQGAFLRVKLRRLADWNAQRIRAAGLYEERLASSGIARAGYLGDESHVYHVYAVQSSEREPLREHLAKAGVQTGIHYPVPIHLMPPYRHFGGGEGSLPVTEELARTLLSLPMSPTLRTEQVDMVAEQILSAPSRLS